MATQSTIPENTAVQLYNSVAAASDDSEQPQILDVISVYKSLESFESSNEFGQSCRICRWNRSDMEIHPCPCQCKGSVGFVHIKCLHLWILQRRDNRCEICNTLFAFSPEKISYVEMLKSFFSQKCLGSITYHILTVISLGPIAFAVLKQLISCIEHIYENDNSNPIKDAILGSCALFTSNTLFFHFFEYFITRMIMIRRILRRWWLFGSVDDDITLFEVESDIFEFF